VSGRGHIRIWSCDPSMLGSRLRHLDCSIRVERDERRTGGRTRDSTSSYVSCQGMSPAFPSASIFSFFSAL